MSQRNELESIKKRIKALMETSGFTEVELTNRLEKVGELLEQYNLTMSDIEDMKDEKFVQEYITFGQQKRTKASSLMTGIAYFTNTKCWTHMEKERTAKKEVQYFFFGMEGDVAAAKYLMEICWKTMQQECSGYTRNMSDTIRGEKRVAQNNFQEAFASRIYYRLKDIKDRLDAELKAKQGESRSLMVMKGQLVEAAFAKEGVRLRKIRYYHSRGYDSNAQRAGRKAGDAMNLNRPLADGNSAGRNRLLLE